ncbi:MAG TPA: condensation domain-containing protein, partial [Archangium sp.]|nr:condensation domain-containing protein [Archangium sp.]
LLEGEPLQVIVPALELPLPVVELGALPAERREAEAHRIANEETQRPFDLVSGPPLRVKLLKLADTQHVLLLTMHHIVSDGWSMGVLVRELAALYQAFSAGQPSPLAALPIQYADYAAWQRGWLRDEVLERQVRYWKEQLSGAPALLELPTDKPRPAVQTFRGAEQSLRLPGELSKAFLALCQREGVTPFMGLLAVFQAMLSRYSGQQDISVGTPIAGRTHADTEGLIGFFVNTLVLRTRLEGNPSFRELLGRVRQSTLGAYAHQDIPFEKLVEELKPQRNLSHPPLFQVMFAFQNAPLPALSGAEGARPSLQMRPLEVEGQTAKFALTLSMSETPEGLIGSLQYNTDLFEAGTAARMLEHLQVLLRAVTEQPGRPLATLSLHTGAERQRLLVEWNATQVEFPRDACAHQLFESQARRTPDALAVRMGEESLTYRQLDARANQLAHHLRGLGVGPEVRVGVCFERSPDMVVAILGALKAGGTYVPLDPAYPRERQRYMLADAAAKVLLTQASLTEHLSGLELDVVCLDMGWEDIARHPDEAPTTGVVAGNLAYVIYTSGSTGRPKGVAISHGSLSNLIAWHQRTYAVTSADRMTQVAGTAFDASVLELWPALTSGASIHLPVERVRTEPEALLHWLASEAITLSFLPTPLAEALL